MAIDDSTNYTLTGAQVKDLAARIKAGGGDMTVYVDASFATPSSITGVFLNKALTVPADPAVMFDTILAGNIVVVIFDGGQAQELIELSSVNSNSRSPEVGQAFTSTISTNAVFSAPTVVTLLYDGTLDSWSVETTAVSAVNNGTLTIQHNGTNVQTFTANQSTNATANIETIWADDVAPATPVPPITGSMIDWSTVGEPVSISDYITPATGYTFSNTFGYRIGKLVVLSFAFSGTIVPGENVIGSCSNKFVTDSFGSGRVARWQGGTANSPATIMCLPSGQCRIYSTANNTAGGATVVFIEA